MTPGLSIRESMTAYEKTYAKMARLKKGMRVLDLGCGIGGPARTIASTVGCKVIGITNSEWHVERGTALTKQAGLEDMVEFVHGDFLVCTPRNHSLRAVFVMAADRLDRNCPSPTSRSTRPTRSSRCVTPQIRPRSTARSSAC
jgi:ubiquinone/menaquinone biosynthesis C-methylase UbiE